MRFLWFFRVTGIVHQRFRQHADAGIWHQTKFIGGEWEIFERLKGKIASGHARAMGEAKTAMVAHTGRAPDGEWRNIGPDHTALFANAGERLNYTPLALDGIRSKPTRAYTRRSVGRG